MTTLQKCIVILALLALVTSFSTAYATEVRVGSMGGVGFFVHDNSNIFFFPGAIYSYSGQVYGEFRVKSTPNAYTVGVNYPIGDYSVVGAYLNRPAPISLPLPVGHVAFNQTTDLFYGTQMSQFDFGLRLSLGLDKYKQDFTGGSTEENVTYLALGGGISNEKMDLGALIELPSAKRDTTPTSTKWSGFGFGVIGRMFYGNGPTKLVPLAAIDYRKTKNDFGAGVKTDFTDMSLGLGVGLNHQLNENNLLVLAAEILGYQSHKNKPTPAATTTTTTRLTLPGLYMGVESRIKPWLVGRLGAAQVWQENKTKSEPTGLPTTETSTRQSQYNVVFGLGINFGDFTVDAAINEGIFFDGPNFISGSVNPLANRLAVVYKF